jgi:hypothetical protein
LQQKHCSHDLTHERRFIPPESLERPIVEIGKALETERQVAGGFHDKTVWAGRPVVRNGFGMLRVTVAAIVLVVPALESEEFGGTRQMLRAALYPIVSAIAQDLSLDREQFGLNGSSAPQSPQQGRQAKHELTLDRRADVMVSDDGRLESLIVVDVLDNFDDCFG